MFLKLLSVLQLLAVAQSWCNNGGICNKYNSKQDCVRDTQGPYERWQCCACIDGQGWNPPTPPNPPPRPNPRPVRPPNPPSGNPGRCVDSTTFEWRFDGAQNNCRYLKNDVSASERNTQCNKTLQRGDNAGTRIKDECKKTCGNCPGSPPAPTPRPPTPPSNNPGGCQDDNSFEWKIRNIGFVDCSYLKNQAQATLRNEQCDKTFESGKFEGISIKDKCKRTCGTCGRPTPSNPPPRPNRPPNNPPGGNCDSGSSNGWGGSCQGPNSCWRDSENRKCSWYEVEQNYRKPRCEKAREWASGQYGSGSASQMCCFCQWQYQGLRKSGQQADGSEVYTSEE